MKKTLMVLVALAAVVAFTPAPAHARVVVGVAVGPVAVGPVVVGGVYGPVYPRPAYVYGRPWGYPPYPYAYGPRYVYARPYWGPRVYAYGPRYYGPRYYGPRYGYRR